MKKFILCATLSVLIASLLEAKMPHIAICPGATPLLQSEHHDVLNNPEQWAKCAENAELFLVWDGQLLGDKGWINNLDIKKLVEVLKKQNLNLGIEYSLFGGPDKTVSQGAAAAEFLIKNMLDKIYAEGGSVHSLHLDGPEYRLLKGLHRHPESGLTLEEFAGEMLLFYQTVHKKYPHIKIGLISDPHAWNYDKDTFGYIGVYTQKSKLYLKDVLNAVYEKLKANNENIAFIETDQPYPYYIRKQTLDKKNSVDAKKAFLAIQEWCKTRKIDLMCIINTEPKYTGDGKNLSEEQINESNTQYAKDCIDYIKTLHADGIAPDWLVMETWYKIPAKNIPETKEGTFFHSTNLCIDTIKKLYNK